MVGVRGAEPDAQPDAAWEAGIDLTLSPHLVFTLGSLGRGERLAARARTPYPTLSVPAEPSGVCRVAAPEVTGEISLSAGRPPTVRLSAHPLTSRPLVATLVQSHAPKLHTKRDTK